MTEGKPAKTLQEYKYENKWLKTAEFADFLSLTGKMKASVKYKVIYRHREKYSISEMRRFFEVSRKRCDYVRRMDNWQRICHWLRR